MSNVMVPSTGPQGYAGYTPAHQYHAMVKSSKAKEAYKSVDLSELIIIFFTFLIYLSIFFFLSSFIDKIISIIISYF